MAYYDGPIQHLTALDILSWDTGLPICDCCGEQLAQISYDSDSLCVGCATTLAAQGEPVAQYGRQITPRR